MFSSFLSLFFECANEQLVIMCVSICTWRPETDAMCASLLLSTGFWRRGLSELRSLSFWLDWLTRIHLFNNPGLGLYESITRPDFSASYRSILKPYTYTASTLFTEPHSQSNMFPTLKKKGKLGKEDWACSSGLNYFFSIQKTLVHLQVSK